MKKFKHEAELTKEALAAGIKYAEGRGIILGSLLFLLTPSALADTPLYVGVIEQVGSPNTVDQDSIMSQPHVRVAFEKKDGNWMPTKASFSTQEELANDFPKAVNWTVMFDGKQLGRIKSRIPSVYDFYGDAGIHLVTPGQEIPKVKTDTSDFANTAGPARFRPLLVASAPNFKDPDTWKRTSLSQEEQKRAVGAFRKILPLTEYCADPNQNAEMIAYANDEIALLKAYRSKSGEILYGEKLKHSHSSCDYFDNPNYFDYWFVQATTGVVRMLDTEMTPIDAADLDNSGSSEWVFQTSRGEDEDGYELFYDDFSKKVYFSWTYH